MKALRAAGETTPQLGDAGAAAASPGTRRVSQLSLPARTPARTAPQERHRPPISTSHLLPCPARLLPLPPPARRGAPRAGRCGPDGLRAPGAVAAVAAAAAAAAEPRGALRWVPSTAVHLVFVVLARGGELDICLMLLHLFLFSVIELELGLRNSVLILLSALS